MYSLSPYCVDILLLAAKAFPFSEGLPPSGPPHTHQGPSAPRSDEGSGDFAARGSAQRARVPSLTPSSGFLLVTSLVQRLFQSAKEGGQRSKETLLFIMLFPLFFGLCSMSF